ncbi:MAG: lysophospholipid acyltransferase family protein [Candidatus Margulisbacteria bacterium]|nr:lysophospholipid acyltransferase family protein [Candidatus Margulisiibacteriota bacterium]
MIYLLNFLRFIGRFVFWLPAPAAIYLMELAGEITYRIARLTPFQRTVANNFKLVFPDADHWQLADRALRNAGHSIFEIICAPYFKKTHLDRITRVIGIENLDAALAQRKGAICLSLHSGNYELIAALLSSRGYHLTTVMKSPPGDRLYQFLDRSRLYHGSKLINILDGDMYRECLQALARHRCVGILVDTGAMEGRHEMMPFLGHQVPIATGWTALAQRSEAPVVPIFSKREGDKVVFEIGEPRVIHRDNKAQVMAEVRDFYEHKVKAHPDQWAIFLNEHEVKRMMGQ